MQGTIDQLGVWRRIPGDRMYREWGDSGYHSAYVMSHQCFQLSNSRRVALASIDTLRGKNGSPLSGFGVCFVRGEAAFVRQLDRQLATVRTILGGLRPIRNLLRHITLLRGAVCAAGGIFAFRRTYVCVNISRDVLCGLASGGRVPRCGPHNGVLCFTGRRLST